MQRINYKQLLLSILVMLASIMIPLVIELVFFIPSLWLPRTIYLIKIGFWLLGIWVGVPYLIRVWRKQPQTIIALFALACAVMVYLHFSIQKGKNGFVTMRDIPNEYSATHWYFLNRISPFFPFDRTGSAYISKKDGLTLPQGYRTEDPIVNDGWYTIITHRFYYASIAYGLLMGTCSTMLFCYFINKKPSSYE